MTDVEPTEDRTTIIAMGLASASDIAGLGMGIGKTAVTLFLRNRVRALQEGVNQEIARGKIGPLHLYDKDYLGGGFIRLQSAIRKGVRTKNVLLLARYYFGPESEKHQDYDASVEDAAIIETLTDAELRCLAVFKTALDSGWLKVRTDDPTERVGIEPHSIKNVDLLGLFDQHMDFLDACMMLQRHGFARQVSVWGGDTFEPTSKLPAFLERLDLEGLVLG